MDERIILGIDPGLCTGYGVIRSQFNKLEMLTYGCISSSASKYHSERHRMIFEEISCVIDQFRPKAVAVEMQFIAYNKDSGIKIGVSRGIATLAASLKGIPVFGYAAVRAKKAVVGKGNASKGQVAKMIQLLLGLSDVPKPEDATDALALAICHSHVWQTNQHEKHRI